MNASRRSLLTLGLAEADLDVPSLLTDTVTVELIRIHGIRALYAFANDTTNVDALIAQLVPPKPAAEPAPGGKRVGTGGIERGVGI